MIHTPKDTPSLETQKQENTPTAIIKKYLQNAVFCILLQNSSTLYANTRVQTPTNTPTASMQIVTNNEALWATNILSINMNKNPWHCNSTNVIFKHRDNKEEKTTLTAKHCVDINKANEQKPIPFAVEDLAILKKSPQDHKKFTSIPAQTNTTIEQQWTHRWNYYRVTDLSKDNIIGKTIYSYACIMTENTQKCLKIQWTAEEFTQQTMNVSTLGQPIIWVRINKDNIKKIHESHPNGLFLHASCYNAQTQKVELLPNLTLEWLSGSGWFYNNKDTGHTEYIWVLSASRYFTFDNKPNDYVPALINFVNNESILELLEKTHNNNSNNPTDTQPAQRTTYREYCP